MKIKEVEALVGIKKTNIRFYEREGLLNPERSEENNYREYSEEDVRKTLLLTKACEYNETIQIIEQHFWMAHIHYRSRDILPYR